jgi:dTDP-4-amino-4,6-dideoxygalactose transaminase
MEVQGTQKKLALLGGAPLRTRPFPAWPVFDEREEHGLLEVLHSGKWWRFSYGEGVELREPEPGQPRSKVAEFQEDFARRQDARYGIACANGTAALEIALKALGIGPGDEVIVPPYTFIATASAVLQVNAIPIFADIDANTYNLEPAAFRATITPRTKAVIPVHFAGQAADMDAIGTIAREHGLLVVEDAAHAPGGKWQGRGLGSLGDAGAFSFQASKNMTAGEGGLITTSRSDVAEMCESYLWAGRKLGRPWYEHYRLGWNYRLTEFQAAILLAQLSRLDDQLARRNENASYLSRQLSEIPGIRPLDILPGADVLAWHIYVFRFNEEEFGIPRSLFLEALAKEGIECFGGYEHPLYRNPMFLNQDFYPRGCPVRCGHYGEPLDYAAFAERCPNAERACHESVWLAHRMLLGTLADMQDIVDAVAKIYEERTDLASRAR